MLKAANPSSPLIRIFSVVLIIIPEMLLPFRKKLVSLHRNPQGKRDILLNRLLITT